MSLEQLSPEWQQWVRDNVARACTAESMLSMMVQGGLARSLGERALTQAGAVGAVVQLPADQAAQGSALADHMREAMGSTAGAQGRRRPSPRLQGNCITLSDGCQLRIATQLDHPQVLLYEGLLSPDLALD